MANPNLVNVTSIYANSINGALDTTVTTDLLTCGALPPTRRSRASKLAKRFIAAMLPEGCSQNSSRDLHQPTEPIPSAQIGSAAWQPIRPITQKQPR